MLETMNDFETNLSCRKCGQALNESNTYPKFWKQLMAGNGRNRICRACNREARRVWKRENPEKYRAYFEATRDHRLDYLKAYYRGHKEKWKPDDKHRSYCHWYRNYLLDWVFLELGNKCDWCGRGSQEIELQVDHRIGAIRLGRGVGNTARDYIRGEPMRLLCIQCHEVRHAL